MFVSLRASDDCLRDGSSILQADAALSSHSGIEQIERKSAPAAGRNVAGGRTLQAIVW
jgi:hypothetical protein